MHLLQVSQTNLLTHSVGGMIHVTHRGSECTEFQFMNYLNLSIPGRALMVIGSDTDRYYGDFNNTVTIETLEDRVPACLPSLNASLNATGAVKYLVAQVLGKVSAFITGIFLIRSKV